MGGLMRWRCHQPVQLQAGQDLVVGGQGWSVDELSEQVSFLKINKNSCSV